MVRSYAVIPFFLLTSFSRSVPQAACNPKLPITPARPTTSAVCRTAISAPMSVSSRYAAFYIEGRAQNLRSSSSLLFKYPETRGCRLSFGDRAQAQRQVEDMISRGIDGAIIDWYGTENADLGRTPRPIANRRRAMRDSISSSVRTKALSSIVPRGRDAIRPVSSSKTSTTPTTISSEARPICDRMDGPSCSFST